MSYAIGIAEPLAVYVKTDKGNFDCTKDYAEECTPTRIINDLHLRDTCYYRTAMFGHFGILQAPWEKAYAD